MTHEHVSAFTAKELYELIIGQAGLRGYGHEIRPVEPLEAVRETYPAEVVAVYGQVGNGALKQSVIYVITKNAVPPQFLVKCQCAYQEAQT